MSDSLPDPAGACFRAELVEQPEALLRLLDGASIVPGQLVASSLAAARGLDPEHPAGLRKVTLAT